MEKKLKHLELIQNVINRMAQTSFLLKGWAVTLVAGLLALSSATQERIAFLAIAYLPLIVFWILDAYYLWQERLFRAIYDEVRGRDENEIDFSMNPPGSAMGGRNTWLGTAFSKTILIFYLSLVLTVIGIMLFLMVFVPTAPVQR